MPKGNGCFRRLLLKRNRRRWVGFEAPFLKEALQRAGGGAKVRPKQGPGEQADVTATTAAVFSANTEETVPPAVLPGWSPSKLTPRHASLFSLEKNSYCCLFACPGCLSSLCPHSAELREGAHIPRTDRIRVSRHRAGVRSDAKGRVYPFLSSGGRGRYSLSPVAAGKSPRHPYR